MTESELRRLLRKWQKKLGLLDWTVTIEPGPPDPGNVANVSWEPDEMTASVWLKAPEADTADPRYFTESSLVHELIHIVFYGHEPVPDYDVNIERAINKLTKALLPDKRKDA